jgi:hypothetical protein
MGQPATKRFFVAAKMVEVVIGASVILFQGELQRLLGV